MQWARVPAVRTEPVPRSSALKYGFHTQGTEARVGLSERIRIFRTA